MAKREAPPEQTRLPIKVILPKQGKERTAPGGGAKPEPFRPVDPAFRLRLGNQVAALRRGDRTARAQDRQRAHASEASSTGVGKVAQAENALLGGDVSDSGRRTAGRVVSESDARRSLPFG